MEDFVKSAKKVLLGNKKKGYTLPTNNKLYPAQWNWDSGFIALGYSHFKLKYALDEIKTLIRGQWKDGMIPHILFHDLNTNYYPNHSVWACGNKIHSSGITQPPILAIILKLILDKKRIKKGDIFVATDVFPEEPVKKNDPIRKLKNVLFSAHRAGALEQAFFDMGEIVLKDMSLILKKKPPKFCKRAERKTVKLLASKPVAIN